LSILCTPAKTASPRTGRFVNQHRPRNRYDWIIFPATPTQSAIFTEVQWLNVPRSKEVLEHGFDKSVTWAMMRLCLFVF
jgi:hypothetical protein